MNNTSDRGLQSIGGKTILLVEDEMFVRNVAYAVLESAGYIVLAAKNADEASTKYEQQSGYVDLLLTDIVLPGEDGRRLARRLSRINSSLQVLLVTGYSEQVGLNGGEDAEHLLRKPFDALTLQRKVRELLDRRQCVPHSSPAGDCVQARLR